MNSKEMKIAVEAVIDFIMEFYTNEDVKDRSGIVKWDCTNYLAGYLTHGDATIKVNPLMMIDIIQKAFNICWDLDF